MNLKYTYRTPFSRLPSARSAAAGFTLLELIVVIAIVGILAAMAVVNLKNSPTRAKEAVLKNNLRTLREVIDQFYADQGAYPSTLEDLVSEGYLRTVPIDPVTGETDWELVYEDETAGADDLDAGFDDWGDEQEEFGESGPGIIDVRSSAPGESLRGEVYSEW